MREIKKIKIEFIEYENTCADGCCTSYHTLVKMNGATICDDDGTYSVLKKILTHLGYDAEVTGTYVYDNEENYSLWNDLSKVIPPTGVPVLFKTHERNYFVDTINQETNIDVFLKETKAIEWQFIGW